ncbi:MAG: NAD-dependent epimerase/dehydratase family protein [Candidatus Bathyarchaeota archaeon]|nr:NAD-dependent epimerase/dehydratase family protein [Candidatus Bathyarchaeota archaeon]
MIVITGCAGFIGTNVTQHFIDKGEHIAGLDVAEPQKIFPKELFTFQKCDLTDKDAVEKIFKELKPNRVVHLAFVTHRKEIFNEFLDDSKITLNMLEASLGQGVERFILMSSSTVYGLRNVDQPVEEDEKPNPKGTYGKAKLMAELMARQYFETENLPLVVFRGFEIYGPILTIPSIVRKLLERAIKKESLQLYCYGKQKTDFTYVEDLCQAMDIVLRNSKAIGEVFNVGSGKAYTYEEFANFINRLLPCKIKLLPPRPGEHPFYLYSTVKKLKSLGFKPKYDVVEGLRKTVDWMLTEHG